MKLCSNCLETGDWRNLEVGPDRGTQRDPYRATVSLCGECAEALLQGAFSRLHERYRAERTITGYPGIRRKGAR